jgi:hypothetical protein
LLHVKNVLNSPGVARSPAPFGVGFLSLGPILEARSDGNRRQERQAWRFKANCSTLKMC